MGTGKISQKYMRKLKGFTLIELVMVIVILGILAVTVIPKTTTTKGSVRLQAACQKLASDLRFMQQMAIAQQVRFGISFDIGDESYFGYRVDTAAKAIDPHTQGDLEVDFDQMTEFNDIVIASTDFSNAIEFDSMGNPYDGNGDALSSEGVLTLETIDGASSKTVRIEPVTGRVSIQ